MDLQIGLPLVPNVRSYAYTHRQLAVARNGNLAALEPPLGDLATGPKLIPCRPLVRFH
jgi:hypothetical protein